MSLFLEMAKKQTMDRKTTDGEGDQDAAKKYKNNFVLGEAIEVAL